MSTSRPIPNPQISVKCLKLWHCELRSLRVRRSLVLIDYCISGLQSRNWVADNRSALRESVSRGRVLCWRQSPAHTLECLSQYCWGPTLSFPCHTLVALVLKFGISTWEPKNLKVLLHIILLNTIMIFIEFHWLSTCSVSEPESEQNFGFYGRSGFSSESLDVICPCLLFPCVSLFNFSPLCSTWTNHKIQGFPKTMKNLKSGFGCLHESDSDACILTC